MVAGAAVPVVHRAVNRRAAPWMIAGPFSSLVTRKGPVMAALLRSGWGGIGPDDLPAGHLLRVRRSASGRGAGRVAEAKSSCPGAPRGGQVTEYPTASLRGYRVIGRATRPSTRSRVPVGVYDSRRVPSPEVRTSTSIGVRSGAGSRPGQDSEPRRWRSAARNPARDRRSATIRRQCSTVLLPRRDLSMPRPPAARPPPAWPRRDGLAACDDVPKTSRVRVAQTRPGSGIEGKVPGREGPSARE